MATSSRLEHELKQRQQIIERLIEAMPGGVVQVSIAGSIDAANAEAQRILGLTYDQLTQRYVADFGHETVFEDGTPCSAEAYPVSRCLATGQRQGPDLIGIRQTGGELAWAVFNAIPLHDPENGDLTGAIVTFLDITERKRAERHLRESQAERETVLAQKLESLGVLSGGIAHDFNNLLTSIWGRVSLARSMLPAGGARRHLDETEKVLKRAQSLTTQLLTFARGGSPVKENVSIASLLAEASQFSVAGSSARCQVQIEPDLWSAEVDSAQVFQAVHDVLINAAQAMPEGGVIDLSAENLVVHDSTPLPVPAGRYVRIAVRDRGIGIEHELLGRIFDPYFTTKPKGSGLGLAVAYSIVRKHGGTISATSQPGQGTVVDIYLPASQGAAVRAAVSGLGAARDGAGAVAQTAGTVQANGRRVLLMDDEPSVRNTATALLRSLGYKVTATADGADAVDRYRHSLNRQGAFDVVLMDLTVAGGTGGLEATRRILALDPSALVVVASGYSDDPVMSRHREHGFAARLAKPYDRDALAEVLVRLLPPPAPAPAAARRRKKPAR